MDGQESLQTQCLRQGKHFLICQMSYSCLIHIRFHNVAKKNCSMTDFLAFCENSMLIALLSVSEIC